MVIMWAKPVSVLQNQDGPGEGGGDDMFFVDGDRKAPTIRGHAGSEDYFLWARGILAEILRLSAPFGAPPSWELNRRGANPRFIAYSCAVRPFRSLGRFAPRSSMDMLITAPDGDYFSSCFVVPKGTEPHAPFPELPPADERIPQTLYPVGGPGSIAPQ